MNTAAQLAAPLALGHMTLPNRLVRSATFEGLADAAGVPQVAALTKLYGELLTGGTGTLITGFTYVSQEGRAMQPGQCGLCTPEQALAWGEIVAPLRERFPQARLVAQLAHTGRQTHADVTGQPVVGASTRACTYFRQPVRSLATDGVPARVEQFALAAEFAQQAGFDAVQLHAAHGYLIHQFLSPWTNSRDDQWGEPTAFLEAVVRAVRERCGARFPVWVKLSWSEDRKPGIDLTATTKTVATLDNLGVDLIEISYGTMEWPMNIFRGECPVRISLRVNPLVNHRTRLGKLWWLLIHGLPHLRRLQGFSPCYNVAAAASLQRTTRVPVLPVGGIRSLADSQECFAEGLPAVGLCRPLVHDPGFARQLLAGATAPSTCSNCNLCAVYCDSSRAPRCYDPKRTEA